MSIRVRLLFSHDGFTLAANFKAPKKGITAVFGPSGSGKTTLMRCIAGLEGKAKGEVVVADEVWLNEKICLPAHKRSVGFVFQEAHLFSHLNVRENLRFGYKRLAQAKKRMQMDAIVELLRLTPLLHRKTTSLSGGERQRVAIGRALLTSPQLLLMDEPLSALDYASRREIYPFLERLAQTLEIPIFYITHQVDEVVRLADHLVLMKHGKVEKYGALTDLLVDPDFSLAQSEEASCVVDAVVDSYDSAFGLCYLNFAAGRLTVVQDQLEIGTKVRLQILARDVSITLEKQMNTSILNSFPAKVISLTDEGAARVLVQLDASGVVILARVTRKSAGILGLRIGLPVFAQVKSMALMGGGVLN